MTERTPPDVNAQQRAALIRKAAATLSAAGRTATGATIFMPSGEVIYLSRETIDAMTGKRPAGGGA